MTILGIDPGFARVGYGVIKKEGGIIKYKSGGLIEIKNTNPLERIFLIEKEIIKIVKKEKPEKAGVEKLFFSKNKKTALRVAEARGVILNALTKNNIKIIELLPSEVKIGVTGSGNASKQAVSFMVSKILGVTTKSFIDDTTDAIAIAITIAYTSDATQKGRFV